MKFIVIVLIMNLAVNVLTAQEESYWRGPDRDGKYPDKGLLKEWPEGGPELLWQFEELGTGFGSPAFANNKIYITGTKDSISYIYALDHSGKLLWKNVIGPEWMTNFPGMRTTPKIVKDRGYILSGLGVLYCFDAENGNHVWSTDLIEKYGGKNIRFGITENLLIDGDILYCTPGGADTNIVALNRFNGDLIWKSKGNGEASAYCAPVIFEHNGIKYFSTVTGKTVLALDLENGKVAWTFPMEYPYDIHGNSPLYHDGLIFVMDAWEMGSFQLKIANDGKSVEQTWKNDLMDLENGDAILIGNNLYGANWEHQSWSCVNWKTGEEKYNTEEFLPGALLYADGLLYWYDITGKAGLIEPTENGFVVKGQFKVPGPPKKDHSAHPVVYDGKLYLRYQDNLWAYNISE